MKAIEIILIILVVGGVIYWQIKAGRKPKKEYYIPVAKLDALPEELELLRLINEYRFSIGITNYLQLEDLASKLCLDQVIYEQMVDKPSHDGFTDRVAKSHAFRAGEVTAQGYHTPKSLISAYLNSPPHKVVLDNPVFTWIGIATRENVHIFNCCLLTTYETAPK